jgi:hypothetical protein
MIRIVNNGMRAILALVAFVVIPACTGSNGNSQPPVFAGVVSASSTVPGDAVLTWNPGVDYSGTGLTYNVAWSLTSGTEDFTGTTNTPPTAVSGVTGTTTTITGLTSGDTYFFMVQAVDGNGVTDANSPEPETSVKIQ